MDKPTTIIPPIKNTRTHSKRIHNPLWLTISEAAIIGGVKRKTIRRALTKNISFKIIGKRYFIDCVSLISHLQSKTKLKNKLDENGIGRFVKEWKNLDE